MSQLSIQSTDDLVTLSLRKFSYSTTNEGASIQWTHSLDPDKVAVFNYVTVRDAGGLLTRRRFLKVIVGGNTLEEISFDDIVREVRIDEERARSMPLPDVHRAVLVIVQKPLVALRYRLPNGQVRRIQMRFLPESGYDTALAIFASYGLPIRERHAQDAAPSSQHSRNLVYSSSPRTTTTPGVSIIANSALNSTSQFEQHSASSHLSRHHSSARTYFTSPSMASSDPPSVFAYSRSGLRTSDGRLESNMTPTSGYRPYQHYLEPTRHPQYNPINPAHPVILDRMNAEPSRPFTAPVPVTSTSTETLSQILPPKRVLPFAKPAPKPVLQDMSTTRIPPSVPESGKPSGEEISPSLENASLEIKAPEKKGATLKKSGRSKLTATPKKKAAPKKKATPKEKNLTPKKKGTPKKKAIPKKNATPKKEAPNKSMNGISDGNKVASDAPESGILTRPPDVTTTGRTESLSESNPLLIDGPATPTLSALISVEWVNKVNEFMEDGNGHSGQDKLASESPIVTAEWMEQVNQFIDKRHLEQAEMVLEPPLITAEWINQVNEFIEEGKGHLEQAKMASETPLVTAGWIDQVNQFMEKKHREQAQIALETPLVTTEWISHVTEFIEEGKGHFENVEIWSHSPLITADWVNRVDDAVTGQTDLFDQVNHLSDQVNHLTNQNHELVEFISNFVRQHTDCDTFSPESCNTSNSATSLRTTEPPQITQIKRPSKRRLGPEYGLTPGERPSKKGRIPRRRLGSGYGL